MTLYTIQSASRTAVVNSFGAELHSLSANASGEEYLWQGDPAVWSGRAPILFPIVGGLKDNCMKSNGKTFAMEKHGFARKQEFTCVEQTNSSVRFRLVANEETLAQFPWSFELLVEFRISDKILNIAYQINNTDSFPMLFNIGSHPAFRLPLDDSTIQDYSIEFSVPETLSTWKVVDDLLQLEPTPYLDNERSIPLTSQLFDHDALVFCGVKSRSVTLRHNKKGLRLTVNTGGAPHLGIWAKPAAPYVCIEPWWGHADLVNASGNFADKRSVQTMAAGNSFSTYIAVTTEDI